MRVFSCSFFSSRFSWPFKDIKDSKSLNAKNHCSSSLSDLSFTGKTMHLNGLISILMVLLIKEECIVAMFSYFIGKLLWGLFISAMSHVKLIVETRVYICHKNMKSMGIFFFYSFSKVFAEKYIKNILQGMKNGLILRQQQLRVITRRTT